MRGILPWLGAMLLTGLVGGAASAQYCPNCPPQAPNAYGPGYYMTNETCGMGGPCYNVYPSVPPVSGVPPFSVPAPGCHSWFGCHQRGLATFPTHPYVRSPRDYFMQDIP